MLTKELWMQANKKLKNLYNSQNFTSSYLGLELQFCYNQVDFKVQYSDYNEIEVFLIIFNKNDKDYVNAVENNRYLSNIPYDLLTKILNNLDLDEFYNYISKEIVNNNLKINNVQSNYLNSEYRLQCNNQNVEFQDDNIDIKNYYDPQIQLNIQNLDKVMDYIEQYHIITDATMGELEDQNGITEITKKIKDYLKEDAGINTTYNGLYDEKTNGNYGFGAIYYLYDIDELEYKEARRIALAIAKEYMKDSIDYS